MSKQAWYDALREIFPVRGYWLRSYKRIQDPDADFDEHVFRLWRQEDITITLVTPREKNGVYEIDGTYRVLIRHGVPGANFPRQPLMADAIRIYTREEILAEIIHQALKSGLVADPDEARCQQVLDKGFATSPFMRQVDPMNSLDIQMTRDTVHLQIGEGLDPRKRLVRDWQGRFDLLTTPQSGRVLQTMQIARGAEINDRGRLTRGKSLFSPGMEACLLFPESTRANRLLAARSALQYREVLVQPEQPRIAHHKYKDCMLYGVHLLTAIMPHPDNYEDCIVVSPGAAAKLECWTFKTYRVSDTLDSKPIVKMGQRIRSGDTLIQIEGGQHVKLEDDRYTEVFDVECCRSHVAGQEGTKSKVVVFGACKAVDGTKIISRAGNKGVLAVRDLPRTQDGRQIEVAIHPKSVLGRRCMGTLREMALANKIGDTSVRVKHFGDEHKLEDLAREGWTQPVDLETTGKAFVGPLYWLRVDKHAQDTLAVMGTERPEDFRGLVPDVGKSGGQRFGHDAMTVMRAKGLGAAAREICDQNREPMAVSLIRRLTTALLHVNKGEK